jgi:hypothetical protein
MPILPSEPAGSSSLCSASEGRARDKRVYQRPMLRSFGRIKELTCAGSGNKREALGAFGSKKRRP